MEAKVGKPVRRKLRKALRKADLTRSLLVHVLRKLIDVLRKLSVIFFCDYGTPARPYTMHASATTLLSEASMLDPST